jgi:U3 small nucleolar RNA-associated protein 10
LPQVGSEKIWRQLNRNLLMKTRDTNPRVRFAALRIVQELFKTIGEDFLMMLPESIPFLSELMEDENDEVERLTQKVTKELEEMSGEKMDEYLE